MSIAFFDFFSRLWFKLFPRPLRVVIYIDGFNLYFGLKQKKWQRYYWLNIRELSLRLLKPNQLLKEVKYFTSRVSSTRKDPDKATRQNEYLEAIETLPHTKIFYGHYQNNSVTCFKCNSTWTAHDEKMTDVNIATELIVDAFRDIFDVAILISGDSDLAPAILSVKKLFKNKQTIICFPPKRVSKHLKKIEARSFTLGRKLLASSQFPNEVLKPSGHKLKRPSSWN